MAKAKGPIIRTIMTGTLDRPKARCRNKGLIRWQVSVPTDHLPRNSSSPKPTPSNIWLLGAIWRTYATNDLRKIKKRPSLLLHLLLAFIFSLYLISRPLHKCQCGFSSDIEKDKQQKGGNTGYHNPAQTLPCHSPLRFSKPSTNPETPSSRRSSARMKIYDSDSRPTVTSWTYTFTSLYDEDPLLQCIVYQSQFPHQKATEIYGATRCCSVTNHETHAREKSHKAVSRFTIYDLRTNQLKQQRCI